MRRKSALSVPLVFALAFGLAACTTGSETSQEEPSPTETASAATECIAASSAEVDTRREALDLVLPADSLDIESLKGKKLWVINVLTNQFISTSNEGYESAAEAAGIDLTIFDGQGAVNTWDEGMQQAIAQGADAIALVGIDSSIITESVKDAAEAGIPVVESLATSYNTERLPELFSNISTDSYADGAALAHWTLADSACTADTFLLYSSAVPIFVDMQQGALDTYAELCPECAISDENVDLGDAATELPRLTQTKLSQSPDTRYIITTWDSAMPFVESAATQLRPDAAILGRDGLDEALNEIRTGGMQKVTVAVPPPQWIAWVVVDDLLRAMAGEPASGIVVPSRLIDETNIGESNDQVTPAYVDFESEFKSVWGQ